MIPTPSRPEAQEETEELDDVRSFDGVDGVDPAVDDDATVDATSLGFSAIARIDAAWESAAVSWREERVFQ